ncbi:MAG: ATP-binding protein [Anaerolineaceae bacterium]|nr:ATP-binding protein [Anaerolineaceae bacterium]
MRSMTCNIVETPTQLKMDEMALWLREMYLSQQDEESWVIIVASDIAMNMAALKNFTSGIVFGDDWHFLGSSALNDAPFPVIHQFEFKGDLTMRVGAFAYEFQHADGSPFEVIVTSAYYSDEQWTLTLAALPREHLATWGAFCEMCYKLSSPEERVTIVGGRQTDFVPSIQWDDIILPDEIKSDLFQDVQSFFQRGVGIYNRLQLNPFRKILLAGPPGTGKTMLCNSLALWAIEQGYRAIYVSGADQYGAEFYKVHQALYLAQMSDTPTLIIVEELDAFLEEREGKQKALVLNVLDGVEALKNEHGTLLIATTNYPEAIDVRVLKRPGRLDRIYMIPEIKDRRIAEAMLRKYLGDEWRNEHAAIASEMVDYPGAFIREVVVYALTQMVTNDETEVTLAQLRNSLDKLKTQIDERDQYIGFRVNGKVAEMN